VSDASVDARLLAFLRDALAAPGLAFAEPPAPLLGGLDARIFAFRLSGAPPALAGPLILRLFARRHDPRRALRERAIQDAVAAQGYPAPRCFLATADPAPLGGAFIVMERRPGRPPMGARALGMGGRLVDLQAQLHALDPAPVLRALAESGLDPDGLTFGGYLAALDAGIRRLGLDGLRPAMAWLLEHRPAQIGRPVLCHGDFHPQNLLVDGKAVTAVLDWPNAVIGDPAADVAATRLILALTPIDLIGVPPPLRLAVAGARRVLVHTYLAAWRRRGAPAPERLAYHEAAAAMRWLVQAAAARAGATGEPPGALETSAFPELLAARFAEVTRIEPRLPPRGVPA
jgi:aminoglycoside phosphotransferase (APT) family kinase protein